MGLQVGPFFIHVYGILIMLGALAGAWLTSREAIRRGHDPNLVWDSLIWILVGGIIGARIWHILTPSPSLVNQGITTSYYLSHPLAALAIWRGGLGIPGAVAGGVLALALFARRHHLSLPVWLDMAAPGLALGQAIGRWGNFANQELYGAPTHLPWAIYIDPQHRLPGFESQAYYHPLFLYESLWNLGNMLLLLWLGRRFVDRLKTGDLFLIYLVTYPLGRFLLEFLRMDSSQLLGVNANQWLMVVVATASLVALGMRHLGRDRTSASLSAGHADGA